MRLKDDEIARLADKIITELSKTGQATLTKERGTVLAAVREAISADIKAEADLERDAERLLEENLRILGGEATIDRHKMLRMVKEKLARERKIVL